MPTGVTALIFIRWPQRGQGSKKVGKLDETVGRMRLTHIIGPPAVRFLIAISGFRSRRLPLLHLDSSREILDGTCAKSFDGLRVAHKASHVQA
jgi:hypothetical protein